MRNYTVSDAHYAHHNSRTAEKLYKQQQQQQQQQQLHQHQRAEDISFEDSVGYRLATEGGLGGNTMGAGGALQIWPRLSDQTTHHLHQLQQQQHHHHQQQQQYLHHHQQHHQHTSGLEPSISKSRDDVSTLHSYRSAPRSHHEMSQPSSMYSIKEAAKFQSRHTLHTSTSHSDFHKDQSRKKLSKTPHLPRGGLGKIFSASKQHLKNKHDAHKTEREQEKGRQESPRYYKNVTPTVRPPPPPVPPSDSQSIKIIQRSHNTTFERNATENAKINVRRPPKGIKHWFDGLDLSDEEISDAANTPSEPATSCTTNFHPSLGPGRLRAAPTPCISPNAEPTQDYFAFDAATSRRESAPHHTFLENSVLNLSSSDESEPSEPPSPDCWPEPARRVPHRQHRRPRNLYREKSSDGRDSITSTQTTATSGTIPIMNADSIFRSPLPPPPLRPQPNLDMPAPPNRTKRSDMATASRQRAATNHSLPESVRSDASAATNSSTHVMTVTQEEMVLLEMMRRKRAEMHTDNHQENNRLEPQPRQLGRDRSLTKSIASSTLSHESDRSILGTAFPAPPTKSADRKSGRSGRVSIERHYIDEQALSDVKEVEEYPRSKKSVPSTIESSICQEPNEQTLPATAYSTLSSKRKDSKPCSKPKAKMPLPSGLSADPYQLAPDLDFSPLDLLPLPSAAYSPTLSTSRSSTGAGSQFSAITPDGASFVGTGVTNSEMDEPSLSRNASVKGAGNDVLAAWNALGGI